MSNSVFVVTVTNEDGDDQCIHSVWQKEEDAENEVSRLESTLRDVIASYEEHELL